MDENDNSPEFDITSDTSVDIAEDSPMGKKVAVVLGRDRDAGLNGLVRKKRNVGEKTDSFWWIQKNLQLNVKYVICGT